MSLKMVRGRDEPIVSIPLEPEFSSVNYSSFGLSLLFCQDESNKKKLNHPRLS